MAPHSVKRRPARLEMVMDDELLSEILAVEQEVAERTVRLEAEALCRRDELVRELALAEERARAALEQESAEMLAASERDARLEAAGRLQEAEAAAARLDSLGDEELTRILARYLERLFPEG